MRQFNLTPLFGALAILLIITAIGPVPRKSIKVELSDPDGHYAVSAQYLEHSAPMAYELKINFLRDFRNDAGTSWAGVVLSNDPNGKHGPSDGYLAYARINGAFGIGGGPGRITGNEVMTTASKSYSFILEIDRNVIRIRQNGATLVDQMISGDYRYLTPNAGGCNASIEVKARKN